MNISLSRHDLGYLISALLLVVATVTAATGLVSDLWDLNDFVYHKYAGYILAVLGLAHVALHWGRLRSYTRWRLRGHPRVRRSVTADTRRRVKPPQKARTDKEEGRPSGASWLGGRLRLSRRDFIPLALGGGLGLALGRLLRPEPDLPYGGDVGIMYHEWSKPKLLSLLAAVSDWGRQPPQYKEYPSAQRISLPPPGEFLGLSTEEAIQRRRSRRNYSAQAMTLEELSTLLYHTGGITGESWGHKLRSAPSAGALYPIEAYLLIHRVEGLEPGLYHYAVLEHALELLHAGDLRGEIVKHGLMQEFLGQANLVIVFTAIFQRLRWKYQERSYRYALIEAGHLGQNLYLAGTSMGLGACAVGAFLDEDLNALLGVDGQEEAAIYMLAAGKL
ncbi:MAG: SagB/ThcOx family dehydrogenase [Chloroflexi bacterium]|jgi:SagB-type dehydrogenase family enzyme|nr:SagB/ThcOx family dehydrogenase [Chloroflexota bacterium]